MNLAELTWLIPLPPFIAFLLILLFTHQWRKLSQTIAVSMMCVSFVLVQFLFWQVVSGGQFAEKPIASSVAWLPFRGVETWLKVGVMVDPLTAVILFMVSLTCLLIFVYSIEYMRSDPRYGRFFAYISLFAAAMLGLVVADNLLVLFVFWEIMGLCSYLLIGFWFEKPSASRAAMKAFMVTRVGDVLLLLGIVALYAQTNRLDFVTLLNPSTLSVLSTTPSVIQGLSVAGLAGLLLFAGTVGKSAQFPLHVWLPDAMEGPTPVSAMIHAATMVSAGVYLSVRMFPLLTAGGTPLPVMAVIGGFTAFFAATIALAQNDIKRVMAYSTISQLAYMVAALGVGAYAAAIFHLLMHAFFKALLFLSAGSVIKGAEQGVEVAHQHVDVQDMLNLGGLRRKMPRTFIAFMAGGLALTGIPPLAGFWSKDAILSGAFEAFTRSGVVSWGFYVWLLLSATVFLTSLYVGRQMFLTFGGSARSEAAEHATETGWLMSLPLIVLAAVTTFAGFIGVPEQFPVLGQLFGGNWLLRFVGLQYGENPLNFGIIGISIALSLAGWGTAWLLYGRKPLESGQDDPLISRLGPIRTLIKNKYFIDELYWKGVIRPVLSIAAWVYRTVERAVIDGFLNTLARTAIRLGKVSQGWDQIIFNGTGNQVGRTTKGFGQVMRAIQTGRLQDYLIIMVLSVLGIAILMFHFIQ